jgi:hypothetical protein
VRQKCILLAFVETVNLIDKHNGSLGLQTIQSRLRLFNRFSNVFHAPQHRTDADELGGECIGHEPCDGCFTNPWRAPQNTTVRLSRFKRQPERQALTNEVLLANDFAQVPGPQPLCQGLLQMNTGVHGRITCAPAGTLN